MNVETGSMKQVKSGQEPPKGYIAVSPYEMERLKDVPDEKRPEELALIRFIHRKKLLNAPCGLGERSAFRQGFQACQEFLSVGRSG